MRCADLNHSTYNSANAVYDPKGLCPTLLARDYKDPKVVMVDE